MLEPRVFGAWLQSTDCKCCLVASRVVPRGQNYFLSAKGITAYPFCALVYLCGHFEKAKVFM